MVQLVPEVRHRKARDDLWRNAAAVMPPWTARKRGSEQRERGRTFEVVRSMVAR
jgi:hypothetical protein